MTSSFAFQILEMGLILTHMTADYGTFLQMTIIPGPWGRKDTMEFVRTAVVA